MLLFHSGFAWMTGGFLGVSTFFTLSGFLITSLLVAESERKGGVSIGGFWSKRLRRLLPAAILAVAGVVVSSPLWLPATQRERLTGDALACLTYLVNWRFVSAEYAYTLIFSDPSPLQHFWSLAIEGQFYLFYPLVVGGLLRLGAGVRGLAVTLAILTIGSVAIGTALGIDLGAGHRIYYGSDTRAAELLIGALLALALRGRVAALEGSALRLAGPIALALMVVLWVTTDVESLWLYLGGFAAYAVLSASVIAAAVAPRGVVRGILSQPWLRWIGKVSYGSYLYHWPLFLVLDAQTTGLGPVPLFVLRVAATLLLAGLSYRFVEEPIRRARMLPGWRFAAASASGIVAAGALAVLVDPTPLFLQARLAMDQVDELLDRDDGAPDAPDLRAIIRDARVRGAPAHAGQIRFGIFGDSTALSLSQGLATWLKKEGGARPVGGKQLLGCGVLDVGWMENRGHWMPIGEPCHGIAAQWAEVAARRKVELAVVLVAPWEVRNRRLVKDGNTLVLGDPELDGAMRDAIARSIDELAQAGTAVVWLTSPYIRVPALQGKLFDSDVAASEPARIDRLNEIIREVVATKPDKARVVDLAAYVSRRPGGDFAAGLRRDNVHFTAEGAWALSEEWLGPEVLRAYASLRPESARASTSP